MPNEYINHYFINRMHFYQFSLDVRCINIAKDAILSSCCYSRYIRGRTDIVSVSVLDSSRCSPAPAIISVRRFWRVFPPEAWHTDDLRQYLRQKQTSSVRWNLPVDEASSDRQRSPDGEGYSGSGFRSLSRSRFARQ